MLKQGTKLYSILKLKCPHCHEGDFFKAHPYNLVKAGNIYDKCPVCGEKYSKEPGFYFGGMYVSYALGVALFVADWVLISLFFPNASVELYATVIVVSLVLFAPLMYALSKIIWANFFFTYKGRPNINQAKKNNQPDNNKRSELASEC